jgi:hypothetical protein
MQEFPLKNAGKAQSEGINTLCTALGNEIPSILVLM